MSFFLNFASVRVIDSRVVPMSWEMSSWVSVNFVRTNPFVTAPSAEHSNKNLASLSEIECDNPTERMPSHAS
jgi:hypothetical protein